MEVKQMISGSRLRPLFAGLIFSAMVVGLGAEPLQGQALPLAEVHAGDDGIKSILSSPQHLHRFFRRLESIGA